MSSQVLISAMCALGGNGVLLIRIECKLCCLIFFLCRSCFRGHIYCSGQCRAMSKRNAHRKSQSKYRTSEKGRKANRDAQRKRRIQKKQKSVADRGSISPPKHVTMPPINLSGKIACLFCQMTGIVVMRFFRRGYGPASAAGPHHSNTNHRRYHAYGKNIGLNSNSPDP